MARCDCCGCEIASDYGTSTVVGDGSAATPFTISKIDPNWQRPHARVRRTTTQSITPSGTFNAISFDTEVFDFGGFWVVGSPTLFTIPEDGMYIFGGCGIWAANATGTRELGIRKNGTDIIMVCDSPPDGTNGATMTPRAHVTYQSPLVAGNTLELVARQESGGALNMTAEADDSIVFWIVYAGKKVSTTIPRKSPLTAMSGEYQGALSAAGLTNPPVNSGHPRTSIILGQAQSPYIETLLGPKPFFRYARVRASFTISIPPRLA